MADAGGPNQIGEATIAVRVDTSKLAADIAAARATVDAAINAGGTGHVPGAGGVPGGGGGGIVPPTINPVIPASAPGTSGGLPTGGPGAPGGGGGMGGIIGGANNAFGGASAAVGQFFVLAAVVERLAHAAGALQTAVDHIVNHREDMARDAQRAGTELMVGMRDAAMGDNVTIGPQEMAARAARDAAGQKLEEKKQAAIKAEAESQSWVRNAARMFGLPLSMFGYRDKQDEIDRINEDYNQQQTRVGGAADQAVRDANRMDTARLRLPLMQQQEQRALRNMADIGIGPGTSVDFLREIRDLLKRETR